MRNPTRPTIGVLFGFHIFEGAYPGQFAFPLMRGMQTAARDQNVNLMIGCGVAHRLGSNRHRPAWPLVEPDMDFVPVGPWNTDGLLVVVPLLTERKIRFTRQLVDQGFPLLYIGGDSGSPAIVVDNQGGIRLALEHLVKHGHRSIAFIAGDDSDSGDSSARLKAYREGVEQFGLNPDPRLLDYGYHWEIGGYQSAQRMLQSGVKFTAVMCSDDLSAIGAIRALREAGLSVPGDVSVTGFNDLSEGLAQVPPLTSVHYPLFETGYRALVLLRKRIEQGAAAMPDLTHVSTWLVPRQSCGCLPEMVTRSAVASDLSQPPMDSVPPRSTEELAECMRDELLSQNPNTSGDVVLPLCQRLADDFQRSLEDGDGAHFLASLTVVLQQVEADSDDSVYLWQSVVSVLRRAAYAGPDDQTLRFRRAEDLLHQARTMLSESINRRYARLLVRRTRMDEAMGSLTARLISSSDEDQVYGTLRDDLSRIGVRSCNIVFFDPKGEDPAAGSVLRPLEPGAPVRRFDSRQFPPPGVYPEGEPFSLALLPLIYQNEKLGYVAFDGENLDPLATLTRLLSSSIKNAQLHAKVLELSLTDDLTSVHNRRFFEIMLQKETERSRRYKRDLAVIMIDIDRFKGYNDTFGHPAGDEALKEVAHCIEEAARRGLDVVSRYGGEEFVIILPETGTEGAWVVAENVRIRVAGDVKFLQPTTVSLGIVSLQGDQLQSQALVDNADRALYQAKDRGRNRTVIFEDWMLEAAHSPTPGDVTTGPEPSPEQKKQ
jgi:diguanylate cyclase (GGDEF)-like protein